MGEQLIEIEGQIASLPISASTGWYRTAKAIFDRLMALVLLILSAPLLGLAAAAIKVDSNGPALFKQQRVGLNGQLFTIYKLRTMVIEAPAYSFKVGIDDSRITRVGRVLRRSGLDELPQLWNVLRGDMSLIGPRPELPFIVERYHGWDHPRYSLRPGITGWWQIHHRNDVPMHLNLDYDLYYVKHLSAGLDWQIMRSTIRITFKGLFASL